MLGDRMSGNQSQNRHSSDDQMPSRYRSQLLERLGDFRTPDGGFGALPSSKEGTAYHCFLAFGAYQDLGSMVPEAERIAGCLARCECSDGGYSNQPSAAPGAASTTPTTAAALTLLRQLNAEIPQRAGQWLVDRAREDGGFLATPHTPLPDLLSTATALHALAGLQIPTDKLKEPCMDFVDSLWTGRGFCGSWADEAPDVEYTFYGLLALGHLSL